MLNSSDFPLGMQQARSQHRYDIQRLVVAGLEGLPSRTARVLRHRAASLRPHLRLDRVFLKLTGLFLSCLGVLPPQCAVLSLCPRLWQVVLVLQFVCWRLLLLVLFGVSVGGLESVWFLCWWVSGLLLRGGGKP
jgi:hypothetical protein